MDKRIADPSLELLDRDAVRALQFSRLQDMVRWTWATNVFYREMWQSAGVDPDKIDSIERFRAMVPTAEKADFLADAKAHPPFGKRLERTLALRERVDLYTTSGTSGQGTETHAQTARELRDMAKVYSFYFRWAGLVPGDRVGMPIPVGMLAGGRAELEGAVQNDLSVLPLGPYDAERRLALLQQFRPRALLSSTTYIAHLAAIADALPPVDSIEILLAGGEGVGLSYLKALEEQWQAKVYDRFGCAQMRVDHAFTCEHGIGTPDRPGLLHNIDPYVLLEVIDPETGHHVGDGEFGEIVLTSLYHFDNPLVRCRTRDGGVFREAAYCDCGRPFAGIEISSISRTDDVKKIKMINVYPQAVDDVLYSFDNVDEYRVVLRTLPSKGDHATVEVMTRGALHHPDATGLLTAIGERLRERIGIGFDVVKVEDIPRSEYKARRWHDEREGR